MCRGWHAGKKEACAVQLIAKTVPPPPTSVKIHFFSSLHTGHVLNQLLCNRVYRFQELRQKRMLPEDQIETQSSEHC